MPGFLTPRPEGGRPLPGLPVNFWIGALLLLVTAAVYARAGGFAFVTLDDPLYLTHNTNVQAGLSWDTVRWSFSTAESGNYSPLVWLSHALCWSLFGSNPGPHHLVNVGLHLANTALLFHLLHSMTGERWPSAFVAAVFALHPQHVESVAWVSGRKDVLSMLFWLLATRAYLDCARSFSRPALVKVAFWFLLGLLSKPVLVSLPLTLLLLDIWPLKRWDIGSDGWTASAWRGLDLLKEKIPLFLLAAAFSLGTYVAQRAAGAMSTSLDLPLDLRLAQSAVSYVRYLALAFFPAGLSVHYPHPGILPSFMVLAGALLLLAGLTAVAVHQRARRPYLLVGWLWFLVTLVPTIGLVQVGSQIMADRYTYVPMTGLCIATAWTWKDLAGLRSDWRWIHGGIALTLITLLTVLGSRQAGFWKDGETLFQHVLQLDNANTVAQEQLGHIRRDQGRWGEAAGHYRRALASRPHSADLAFHLADALEKLDRPEEALRYYDQALQKDPGYLACDFRIAGLWIRQGRPELAIPHYLKVLGSDPALFRQDPGVTRNVLFVSRLNLGILLRDQNRPAEALVHLEAAIGLDPTNPGPRILRALALSDLGRHDTAIAQLQELHARTPEQTSVAYYLGSVLAKAGRPEQALAVLEGIPAHGPLASEAREQIRVIRRSLHRPPPMGKGGAN